MKTKFELEHIASTLKMPAVPLHTKPSAYRGLIHAFVDQLFKGKDDLLYKMYDSVALKVYWCRLDDYEVTMGGWVELRDIDTLVYITHDELEELPNLPVKSTGPKPTAASIHINQGELRTAHLIRDHATNLALDAIEDKFGEYDDKIDRIVAGSIPENLAGDIEQLKRSILELKETRSAGISDELRAELNALGKGMRKNVLVVHNAAQVDSPLHDAELVLSQLGPVDYGEIRAFRRGRRTENSRTAPLLAINFSSEIQAMKVMDAFSDYRRKFLARTNGARLPFKFENDAPKAVVDEVIRLNKIITSWRDKDFGDLRRHGEKIVYYEDSKYVCDVPIPKGPGPSWPDPYINRNARSGRMPSVYQRMISNAPVVLDAPLDVDDEAVEQAAFSLDRLLASAAEKAQDKGRKRGAPAEKTGSQSRKKVTILPPSTASDYLTPSRGKSTFPSLGSSTEDAFSPLSAQSAPITGAVMPPITHPQVATSKSQSYDPTLVPRY